MSSTYDMKAIPASVTASSTSGSQTPNLAFDGSTSTYWYASTPAGSWIQTELAVATAITRMRFYQGHATYRVINFTIKGSNDAENWTNLHSGTLVSTVGWYEFTWMNTTPYKYYRLAVDSYNSRVYIYEIEWWYKRNFVKADGMYLGIKFSEDFVGDVTGFNPPVGYSYGRISNVTVSSQNSSSYPGTNLIDGSTSTYWYAGTPAGSWIQSEINQPVRGFRWYIGSASYYPQTFTVGGSNDGENWTELYSGTSTSGTGWKEFSFSNTTTYVYYRITINTYVSRVYIYELEWFLPYGNERAFTVSGKEWTYTPGGTLVDANYTVRAVTAHLIEEKALLIEIEPLQRFESIVGDLTISYDATKGSLMGLGGPVEDFELDFEPEDLIAKPNPHDPENIEISNIEATGTLLKVFYTDTKADERIEISNITATGVLTHINDL